MGVEEPTLAGQTAEPVQTPDATAAYSPPQVGADRAGDTGAVYTPMGVEDPGAGGAERDVQSRKERLGAPLQRRNLTTWKQEHERRVNRDPHHPGTEDDILSTIKHGAVTGVDNFFTFYNWTRRAQGFDQLDGYSGEFDQIHTYLAELGAFSAANDLADKYGLHPPGSAFHSILSDVTQFGIVYALTAPLTVPFGVATGIGIAKGLRAGSALPVVGKHADKVGRAVGAATNWAIQGGVLEAAALDPFEKGFNAQLAEVPWLKKYIPDALAKHGGQLSSAGEGYAIHGIEGAFLGIAGETLWRGGAKAYRYAKGRPQPEKYLPDAPALEEAAETAAAVRQTIVKDTVITEAKVNEMVTEIVKSPAPVREELIKQVEVRATGSESVRERQLALTILKRVERSEVDVEEEAARQASTGVDVRAKEQALVKQRINQEVLERTTAWKQELTKQLGIIREMMGESDHFEELSKQFYDNMQESMKALDKVAQLEADDPLIATAPPGIPQAAYTSQEVANEIATHKRWMKKQAKKQGFTDSTFRQLDEKLQYAVEQWRADFLNPEKHTNLALAMVKMRDAVKRFELGDQIEEAAEQYITDKEGVLTGIELRATRDAQGNVEEVVPPTAEEPAAPEPTPEVTPEPEGPPEPPVDTSPVRPTELDHLSTFIEDMLGIRLGPRDVEAILQANPHLLTEMRVLAWKPRARPITEDARKQYNAELGVFREDIENSVRARHDLPEPVETTGGQAYARRIQADQERNLDDLTTAAADRTSVDYNFSGPPPKDDPISEEQLAEEVSPETERAQTFFQNVAEGLEEMQARAQAAQMRTPPPRVDSPDPDPVTDPRNWQRSPNPHRQSQVDPVSFEDPSFKSESTDLTTAPTVGGVRRTAEDALPLEELRQQETLEANPHLIPSEPPGQVAAARAEAQIDELKQELILSERDALQKFNEWIRDRTPRQENVSVEADRPTIDTPESRFHDPEPPRAEPPINQRDKPEAAAPKPPEDLPEDYQAPTLDSTPEWGRRPGTYIRDDLDDTVPSANQAVRDVAEGDAADRDALGIDKQDEADIQRMMEIEAEREADLDKSIPDSPIDPQESRKAQRAYRQFEAQRAAEAKAVASEPVKPPKQPKKPKDRPFVAMGEKAGAKLREERAAKQAEIDEYMRPLLDAEDALDAARKHLDEIEGTEFSTPWVTMGERAGAKAKFERAYKLANAIKNRMAAEAHLKEVLDPKYAEGDKGRRMAAHYIARERLKLAESLEAAAKTGQTPDYIRASINRSKPVRENNAKFLEDEGRNEHLSPNFFDRLRDMALKGLRGAITKLGGDVKYADERMDEAFPAFFDSMGKLKNVGRGTPEELARKPLNTDQVRDFITQGAESTGVLPGQSAVYGELFSRILENRAKEARDLGFDLDTAQVTNIALDRIANDKDGVVKSALAEDDSFRAIKVGEAVEEMRERGVNGFVDSSLKMLYSKTDANPTTFAHEFAHTLLDTLNEMNVQGALPSDIRKGLLEMMDGEAEHLPEMVSGGIVDGMSVFQERFAVKFENYLLRGEAPKESGLENLFVATRRFLYEVYTNLIGLGLDKTPVGERSSLLSQYKTYPRISTKGTELNQSAIDLFDRLVAPPKLKSIQDTSLSPEDKARMEAIASLAARDLEEVKAAGPGGWPTERNQAGLRRAQRTGRPLSRPVLGSAVQHDAIRKARDAVKVGKPCPTKGNPHQ